VLPPPPKPSSTIKYDVKVVVEHFVNDLPNSSHVVGFVAQIQSLADFNHVLSLHGDGTGLPVIIGLRSKNCEACGRAEPHFNQLAEKFKTRAAFYDIDMDADHSMLMEHLDITVDAKSNIYYKKSDRRPQSGQMFYVQVYESGVLVGGSSQDPTSRGLEDLESVVSMVADESEKKGTYVGKTCVGETTLQNFFTKHDPTKKIDDVRNLSKKFERRTAKLMRQLWKLYGVWPECTSTHPAAGAITSNATPAPATNSLG
jgi:hypothetical protein